MKLEFKHIKRYLGNGIEFKLSEIGIFNLDSEYGTNPEAYKNMHITSVYFSDKVEFEVENKNGWGVGLIELEELKPILRPMSDLVNNITVNGKTFVPIDVINAHSEYNLVLGDHQEISCDNLFWKDNCVLNMLNIIEINELYEKFYEWLFDVDDLIAKDLAVNINEL